MLSSLLWLDLRGHWSACPCKEGDGSFPPTLAPSLNEPQRGAGLGLAFDAAIQKSCMLQIELPRVFIQPRGSFQSCLASLSHLLKPILTLPSSGTFLVAFVFLNLELSVPAIAPLQSSGTDVRGVLLLLLFLGWACG